MSRYQAFCWKCRRPLVNTWENTLCSPCMGGTVVVGHGAVYPADTTKLPAEPLVINKPGFGEVREAEKRGREAVLREAIRETERDQIDVDYGPAEYRQWREGYLAALDRAQKRLRRLLPDGEVP